MKVCLYVATEEFDPVSILIRQKTACAWSHVGFFDQDTQQTFSAMCDGKGVAWRPVTSQQKVMLLSAPRAEGALNAALTQEGKPYDMLDIVGLAVSRDITIPEHFICSTLVLWAFEKIGAPLLGMWAIPLDHMTPRDVLLSPFVQEFRV